MFSFSNALAYDGLTVQGIDADARDPYVYRRASSWVDVVGAEADGHWIPEDGRRCGAYWNGCATKAAWTSPGACSPSARSARSSPARSRPAAT
ncbi:hypothetical protein [Streptomyces sp. NPDC060031]|uniref:hypothetical protein n=1 Tax=Streptomyces sp. NPDC060031 TaxID=3347043 RepID=UPI003673D272